MEFFLLELFRLFIFLGWIYWITLEHSVQLCISLATYYSAVNATVFQISLDKKDHLIPSTDRHTEGSQECWYKMQILIPLKRMLMYIPHDCMLECSFSFCMFSKEKAEIILTMRGSLLGQQFLFHRERVGWHCVKLHKLPLQLWSHFHNELQIAPSWLQLVIAHEALQNSSFKDQSGDLEKWSLSIHHRQCYTPVHRTN